MSKHASKATELWVTKNKERFMDVAFFFLLLLLLLILEFSLTPDVRFRILSVELPTDETDGWMRGKHSKQLTRCLNRKTVFEEGS